MYNFDEPDHPQLNIIQKHIDRAVQDILLNALRKQSDDFVSIFPEEVHIDNFCNQIIAYWESTEKYEICAEAVELKESLKIKWHNLPTDKRGNEVMAEWVESLK